MTTFAERVRALSDEDREGLLAAVADRFEAVDRAQSLVGQRVAEHAATLENSEREFDALLDAIRSDLAAAGEDPTGLSRTDLIDAANEGRVSDATQTRIQETLPRLRESAAAGQAASSHADDLLSEITAESRLYHEIADRAGEGAATADLREAILGFVADAEHGPDGATAVDEVLAEVDPEDGGGPGPDGPGGPGVER
jgi:hypothetical protein